MDGRIDAGCVGRIQRLPTLRGNLRSIEPALKREITTPHVIVHYQSAQQSGAIQVLGRLLHKCVGYGSDQSMNSGLTLQGNTQFQTHCQI